MYSWQTVATVSVKVEAAFTFLSIPNNKRFWFFPIRGAYPFYLLSSLFLLTYFEFMAHKDFKEDFSDLFYWSFLIKFLLTIIIVFMPPSYVKPIPELERYLKECRIDLTRYRCPKENIGYVFRAYHCNFCERCT